MSSTSQQMCCVSSKQDNQKKTVCLCVRLPLDDWRTMILYYKATFVISIYSRSPAKPYQMKLIRLLRCLGSQLHHHKDEEIATKDKDPCNPDKLPSSVRLRDIDRSQVIGPSGIRADLTSHRCRRVQQVGAGINSSHIRLQVCSTGHS